jgi:hypothetical protein
VFEYKKMCGEMKSTSVLFDNFSIKQPERTMTPGRLQKISSLDTLIIKVYNFGPEQWIHLNTGNVHNSNLVYCCQIFIPIIILLEK